MTERESKLMDIEFELKHVVDKNLDKVLKTIEEINKDKE